MMALPAARLGVIAILLAGVNGSGAPPYVRHD